MAPFWVCTAPEFKVDPYLALNFDADPYPAYQNENDPRHCPSLCDFLALLLQNGYNNSRHQTHPQLLAVQPHLDSV
jgi:hypothetical protein